MSAAERGHDATRSSGDRLWTVLALVLLALSFGARALGAVRMEALSDPDAVGHMVNVVALHEGRLPDPESWSGAHPPLYYAAAALAWLVLPEALPVHVSARLVNVAAALLTLVLVWRAVRRHRPAANAAVATALVFAAPGVVVATQVCGNDVFCMLFTTAALVRLFELRGPGRLTARHAAGTGLLAGLAAFSKVIGLIAVAVSALGYLLAARSAPRRALGLAALTGGLGLLVVAPHDLRLLLHFDDRPVFEALSGGAGSAGKREVMASQPPRERALSHYLSLPAETFTNPTYEALPLATSVPGMFHAMLWADAEGMLAPLPSEGSEGDGRAVARLRTFLALAGLLPLALLLLGLARTQRDRELREPLVPHLVLLALFLGGFVYGTWFYPGYSTVKVSYVLPAVLPLALLLATGLDVVGRRASSGHLARGALALIAAGSSALTWYDLWREPPPFPEIDVAWARAQARERTGDPGRVVESYLRHVGPDPARALALGADLLFLAPGRLSEDDPVPGVDNPDERRVLWFRKLRTREPDVRASARIRGRPATDDVVSIQAELTPEGGSPFVQTFLLRQGAGPWRIQRVEQEDLDSSNTDAALAVFPGDAVRRNRN